MLWEHSYTSIQYYNYYRYYAHAGASTASFNSTRTKVPCLWSAWHVQSVEMGFAGEVSVNVELAPVIFLTYVLTTRIRFSIH